MDGVNAKRWRRKAGRKFPKGLSSHSSAELEWGYRGDLGLFPVLTAEWLGRKKKKTCRRGKKSTLVVPRQARALFFCSAPRFSECFSPESQCPTPAPTPAFKFFLPLLFLLTLLWGLSSWIADGSPVISKRGNSFSDTQSRRPSQFISS